MNHDSLLIPGFNATVNMPKNQGNTPIIPAPKDASPVSIVWNGRAPDTLYPYHNAQGDLVSYMARWDREDGKKDIKPVCYGQIASGERKWMFQGISGPYPLYNLTEILKYPQKKILFCEGEKTADAAGQLFPDHIVTTTMFGAMSAHKTDFSHLKGREILIARDYDDPGKKYVQEVERLATEAGAKSVQHLSMDIFERFCIEDGRMIGRRASLKKGYDLADTLEEGWTAELIAQYYDEHGELFESSAAKIEGSISALIAVPTFKINAVTGKALLSHTFPPPQLILSPWLTAQSLNMIHAWRGIGKTHVALEIAYAVASGGTFLGWEAEVARGVLYLDGEMQGYALQERLARIMFSNPIDYPEENLRFVTPDLQEEGMPDLATKEGQMLIDSLILPSTALIIIDNLSCLVRSCGNENDAESWHTIGQWARDKRKQGVSIIFIHHDGKNGNQRGTSKKEDTLDTVIALKRPSDYHMEDGACFEVHFEKARHIHGSDVEPFEARLSQDLQGKQTWTTQTLKQSNRGKIIELHLEGLTPKEIVEELGVNKSTVSRALQEAEEKGMIPRRKK